MFVTTKKRFLIFLFIFVLSSALLAMMLADENQILLPLQRAALTIRWSTENEFDIMGFNLYRADSPGGNYAKVNDTLIPAAEDPVVGNVHSYVDRNVMRGATYYYKLEIVDRHGNGTFQGPYTIVAE